MVPDSAGGEKFFVRPWGGECRAAVSAIPFTILLMVGRKAGSGHSRFKSRYRKIGTLNLFKPYVTITVMLAWNTLKCCTENLLASTSVTFILIHDFPN